jgi:diguanylate cyclase (GGDEF)-like protein/PAS domain S-box-containing protein
MTEVTELGDGLAATVLLSTRALVCVVAGDGRILLANPALQRFTGQRVDDLLGRRFWEVYVVPEHVLLAQDALARAMDTGVAHPQEGDWLAAGGVRRRVSMLNDVLLDDAGQPHAVVCIGRDVTEDRDREAQLHRRAQTDLLTGISNRRALFDALRRHLDPTDGGGCGVLFCDLDEFKEVNDRHGHAVGDELLVEAARRLDELVVPGGLVARLGGDEFMMVSPAADDVRLTALAEAVAGRFRQPFAGPAGELLVGVSVGVAVGRPGEEPDALVARADRAMYGAKSRRRRRDLR